MWSMNGTGEGVASILKYWGFLTSENGPKSYLDVDNGVFQKFGIIIKAPAQFCVFQWHALKTTNL